MARLPDNIQYENRIEIVGSTGGHGYECSCFSEEAWTRDDVATMLRRALGQPTLKIR